MHTLDSLQEIVDELRANRKIDADTYSTMSELINHTRTRVDIVQDRLELFDGAVDTAHEMIELLQQQVSLYKSMIHKLSIKCKRGGHLDVCKYLVELANDPVNND